MPQPYKRTATESVSIRPDAVKDRADLAIEISLIAGHWSNLELELSKIFCALLLRQERKAFDIYHIIRDRDLRKEVLLAAGKYTLDTALRERIKTLYSNVRSVAAAVENVPPFCTPARAASCERVSPRFSNCAHALSIRRARRAIPLHPHALTASGLGSRPASKR